jgi:hypothetical protein
MSRHLGKTIIHSHQDAFMNGSIEKGLGSMELGWSLWRDGLQPLLQKTADSVINNAGATSTPNQITPISQPVAKDNTITYVKYGAMAVGGVVAIALLMKFLRKKK